MQQPYFTIRGMTVLVNNQPTQGTSFLESSCLPTHGFSFCFAQMCATIHYWLQHRKSNDKVIGCDLCFAKQRGLSLMRVQLVGLRRFYFIEWMTSTGWVNWIVQLDGLLTDDVRCSWSRSGIQNLMSLQIFSWQCVMTMTMMIYRLCVGFYCGLEGGKQKQSTCN